MGDTTFVENYRPATISSTFFIMNEYTYLHSLKGFLSKYKILSPHQHEVQSEKSTRIAMISLNNNIVELLEKGECSALILFNLSGAFAFVNYNKFITVLGNNGIG